MNQSTVRSQKRWTPLLLLGRDAWFEIALNVDGVRGAMMYLMRFGMMRSEFALKCGK